MQFDTISITILNMQIKFGVYSEISNILTIILTPFVPFQLVAAKYENFCIIYIQITNEIIEDAVKSAANEFELNQNPRSHTLSERCRIYFYLFAFESSKTRTMENLQNLKGYL